jgi:hypothetical protein
MTQTRSREQLAAMEEIHEIGDEPWWREAWYFELYDPKAEVSLKSYAGIFPNQERADLIFHVSRGGRTVHSVRKMDFHIARDIGAERLSFGPQLLDLLEPGERWRLRYQSDEVVCDLQFDAVQQLFSWGESGIGMETAKTPSNHTDQPGRYTGWVEIEGERLEIDTLGMRDRMWGWGGRKYWKNYLIMWAPFSEDFVVNVAAHQFVDGHVELAGYIYDDGVRTLLDSAEIAIEWHPERWKDIAGVESVLTDVEGRTVTMRSRPAIATIDTGGLWAHRVDHMLFSTGEHEVEGCRTNACFNWAFLTYEGRPTRFSAQRRTRS